MFYGKALGAMPTGTMNVRKEPGTHLAGHETVGAIVMDFSFPSGTQVEGQPHPGTAYSGDHRQAYLPDNKEGQAVLKLFEIGWERKQLFKIGWSETRNCDDLIVYNGIHMKSSTYGAHGYPDPTYLTRVREEFSTKGIYDS